MNQINSIPDDFSQNGQLPIRIVSPDFGHLPPEAVGAYGLTHRLSYYFLHFTLEGTSHQGIDTNEFEIERHEFRRSTTVGLRTAATGGRNNGFIRATLE
ncbi:hypothetical protein [Dyadobacter sp. MSC1_007]|jgi:AraC family transcriptional activator of pobA|uniref:hypothetical protein n=1 Tax=Dyadobacter sp. MSC1_007 TaxID=2909264 RepID=UPI002030CB9B|nr:hypothetical protein [Dyadobacter sp. MSC1_007]